MLTKSSKLLEVGIESLLAGCASVLFSATRAVAVYWTAMNPLDNPGFEPFPTRKAGSPLFRDESNNAAVLLSEILAMVEMARLRISIAIEMGWPWKFPPERQTLSRGKTSGLSVAEFISSSTVLLT